MPVAVQKYEPAAVVFPYVSISTRLLFFHSPPPPPARTGTSRAPPPQLPRERSLQQPPAPGSTSYLHPCSTKIKAPHLVSRTMAPRSIKASSTSLPAAVTAVVVLCLAALPARAQDQCLLHQPSFSPSLIASAPPPSMHCILYPPRLLPPPPPRRSPNVLQLLP